MQPPVINNLPNTTDVEEDTSTRTLIYTLNVTDENIADNITCVLDTYTSMFDVTEIIGGSGKHLYI